MQPSSTHSVATPHGIHAAMTAAVAAIGVIVALAIVEVALRVRHFQFRVIPDVQAGWSEPEVNATDFVADRDLVWVTRDYAHRLADARAGQSSVIFLGDSCVESSAYPRRVLDRLAERRPDLSRGENLAVAGWSSEQGRVQMARDVAPLRPHVVTVEFGWNDHWDALGPPDDEMNPSPIFLWTAEHVRLYEAYRKAILALENRWHPGGPRRVSLARYGENLRTIADAGARERFRVVFITAPTAHLAGAEPEFLRARQLHDLSELVSLHSAYVQATRDVARVTEASLCDAADAFEQLGPKRRGYFRPDGIHFNEDGDAFMSEFVAQCIVNAAR